MVISCAWFVSSALLLLTWGIITPWSVAVTEQTLSPEQWQRLRWQCRRGMLELDVLLVPFVREVYPHLDAEDRERYRKLLESEDQDMFGWFMQRNEPEDDDLKRMVRMILDRVQPK